MREERWQQAACARIDRIDAWAVRWGMRVSVALVALSLVKLVSPL